MVDLTWATPSAARLVNSWRVAATETMSYHLYIEVEVVVASPEMRSRRHGRERPRPRMGSH